MSFEKSKFKVVKKRRLEKGQFNVECNVDCNVEINRIFSVCHCAQVENVETLNGVVNYSGLIDLCILYSTVDGEIGTINASCPFTSKFEDSNICVGDKVQIKVDVEEYSIDNISNSNIKIVCSLVQNAVVICEREVENISTGDENMCICEDEVLVSTFLGEAKEVFNVETEVGIKEPIKKVILSDSQVSIKSTESGVNFVSVSGEVVSRILYLTEKDRFESSYVTETFKEEVEIEGVSRDSVSESFAYVKRNAVKCDVEESDKGVNIKLTVPVEIKVVAFQEKTETVVKDVYSVSNELAVSTESFEMTKTLQGDYFETKIDGTLTLDDDKPRVDKIMFVGGTNLLITNSYLKNGDIYVEGVTKTNVVYLNDEDSALHSVVIEVPFVVSDKSSVSCENAQIDSVFAIVYDVDVVVKKGREFYFDAKVKVNVNYDCDQMGAVISKVEATGEINERDCAIELIFAGAGQSSWEIAKTAHVKEEEVLLQNPNIVFPLEKEENVVIYFQKR